MVRSFASCLIALSCSAACGGSSVPPEAKQVADALTGDTKGAASGNPQCRLFTADELAQYAGEPLGPGTNAAMGSGCQWAASDESGDVMIVVVPSNYHEKYSGDPTYTQWADIGTEGFSARFLDGWMAAAIVGPESIRVTVAGDGASEASAVALLRETIRRRAS
jgi:hypothetical protein